MRSNKFWIAALSALVLVSAGAWLALRGSGGVQARIYSGGELVETIDLARLTQSQTIIVSGPNGGMNTITAENGRICVSAADCPDQVCVHQGWIENGTVPIVCLPNELVIQLGGAPTDVDGVSG